MNFYVYEYRDQKNDKPFYIGKGTGDRYYAHFNLCLKYKSSFYDKLHCMLLEGRREDIIVTKLKSGMTQSEAYDFEIEMIEKYGRLDLGTGPLHNRTAGGDAPWITEDQRVKISNGNIKRYEDPRERERASKRGIAHAGRPVEAFNLSTGATILSFDCVSSVKKKGFDRRHVQKVLNGSRTYHAGYGWRYTE